MNTPFTEVKRPGPSRADPSEEDGAPGAAGTADRWSVGVSQTEREGLLPLSLRPLSLMMSHPPPVRTWGRGAPSPIRKRRLDLSRLPRRSYPHHWVITRCGARPCRCSRSCRGP